jgi:preprotein translocase subunit SecA
MRIFGSDRMDAMLVKLGLKDGEAIIHPWINKALEKAQQKVEARNFDMRKNVLKFDNVMNDQRKVVFEQRREMMAQESLEDVITEMRHGVVEDLVSRHVPRDAYPEAWDIAGLAEEVRSGLNIEPPLADWAKEEGIADEELRDRLEKASDEAYAAREQINSPELTRYIEKQVLLQTLDHLWREHLVVLDHLRQVIGWRGLAQRDPLNEYKSEAFELFDGLITRLREMVTSQLNRIEVARERPPEPQLPPMQAMHLDPATGENELALAQINARIEAGDFSPQALGVVEPVANRDPNDPESWGRVGRNEPCPCGSGKKYKHCHGAFA